MAERVAKQREQIKKRLGKQPSSAEAAVLTPV
jgi:hypothetical protein